MGGRCKESEGTEKKESCNEIAKEMVKVGEGWGRWNLGCLYRSG